MPPTTRQDEGEFTTVVTTAGGGGLSQTRTAFWVEGEGDQRAPVQASLSPTVPVQHVADSPSGATNIDSGSNGAGMDHNGAPPSSSTASQLTSLFHIHHHNNHQHNNTSNQQQQQQQPSSATNGREVRKSVVSFADSAMSRSSASLPSRSQQEQIQWRTVRAQPTWVTPEDDDNEGVYVEPPPMPAPPGNRAERSIHDSRRENVPVMFRPETDGGSRWRTFVQSPPLGSTLGAMQSEKVSPEWLEAHGDLSGPWLSKAKTSEDGSGDTDELPFHKNPKKRRAWYQHLHIMLLNNPLIPLTLRSIIWIFSLIALALAGSLYHISRINDVPQTSSTIMAIVVDAVALVYLVYITYDEYTSKPLGLRSAKAKMRLIMFDLLFIIFDSANLALAFSGLDDDRLGCVAEQPGSPSTGNHIGNSPTNTVFRKIGSLCNRQESLTSLLFLALVAWVMTFTISVFRLVERVSRNG